MFGFEFGHMILLGVIALVAIGPKQLPEVARTLGRMLNEFKRATGDFQKSLSTMDSETTQAFRDVHKSLSDSLQPTSKVLQNFSLENGPKIVDSLPAPEPQVPDPQQAFYLDSSIPGHGAPTPPPPRALDEANQLSFNLDSLPARNPAKPESSES